MFGEEADRLGQSFFDLAPMYKSVSAAARGTALEGDAVRKVFVGLYEKGLIYRGAYIINWDPKAKTALSDIEVIHKDVQGAFYHFRYPMTDGSGYLELATTRPETMLGDTAVAVHPEDERYQQFIGKTVTLPLVNREIPVIADDYVEMDFGTGRKNNTGS